MGRLSDLPFRGFRHVSVNERERKRYVFNDVAGRDRKLDILFQVRTGQHRREARQHPALRARDACILLADG
jgi:hypothetical protein